MLTNIYNNPMDSALFNNLVLIWIAAGLLIFPVLLKIAAPYGRYAVKNWGPMISNRIGWIIMELPALLLFSFFVIKSGSLDTTLVFTAFILWVVHYFNRALIYPFRIRGSNKKMPAAIVGMAFFFNVVNGTINGYWLGYFSPQSEGWNPDPRFVAGVLIFISGFLINQIHDRKLISLRKQNHTGYQIPQGGLFKYVSCPNYLGEIIEWAGFALLTFSLPALSFLIWTMVNLVPRAIDHHRWYRKNFKNYPEHRKAIFPFLL